MIIADARSKKDLYLLHPKGTRWSEESETKTAYLTESDSSKIKTAYVPEGDLWKIMSINYEFTNDARTYLLLLYGPDYFVKKFYIWEFARKVFYKNPDLYYAIQGIEKDSNEWKLLNAYRIKGLIMEKGNLEKYQKFYRESLTTIQSWDTVKLT